MAEEEEMKKKVGCRFLRVQLSAFIPGLLSFQIGSFEPIVVPANENTNGAEQRNVRHRHDCLLAGVRRQKPLIDKAGR